MSNSKTRYPLEQARAVAVAIARELAPGWSRFEIVGSIRRGKPDVGDVEILYIPFLETRAATDSFFDTVDVDLATEQIVRLEKAGVLERRPNELGQFTFGPKNKLMRHVASGIAVDLFATSEDCWWVSLAIRTGGKETNLKLTTGAQRLNRRLHAYGEGVTCLTAQTVDGRHVDAGTVISATSEQHVFELCGVPWQEPKDRS